MTGNFKVSVVVAVYNPGLNIGSFTASGQLLQTDEVRCPSRLGGSS